MSVTVQGCSSGSGTPVVWSTTVHVSVLSAATWAGPGAAVHDQDLQGRWVPAVLGVGRARLEFSGWAPSLARAGFQGLKGWQGQGGHG